MAWDSKGFIFILLLTSFRMVRAAPALPQNLPEEQKVQLTEEQKVELVKQLEVDILRAYALRAVAEGVKLEQDAEDKLIEEAVEAIEENPSPERRLRLEQVQDMLKRDRRAVQVLSGLLSGSSGGAAAPPPPPPPTTAPPPPPPPPPPAPAVAASGGSDSGSILNLVAPLIGSSSGGAGQTGEEGASTGDNSSGSGAILNLVVPLLGSSSGGSNGDNTEGGGGSDSGSILGLIGPLLASSSAGNGATGVGEDNDPEEGGGSDSGAILGLIVPLLASSSMGGGAGADTANAGGSDSGAILNLVGPLLGSSSGGGDGAAGGLGTVLNLLSTSKQATLSGDGSGFLNSLSGLNIKGTIQGAKIAFVGDKIQLLLRIKFGLLTKMINTISGVLAAKFPPDPIGFDNLRYPD